MKQSAIFKSKTAPPRDLDVEIARIGELSITQLRHEWRRIMGGDAPTGLTKDLLARALAYRLQEDVFGGLSVRAEQALRDHARPAKAPRQVKAGSIIVREYRGVLHEVLVVPEGFCWQGKTFGSLSIIAKEITGTNWNGPRFFGLRAKRGVLADPETASPRDPSVDSSQRQGRGSRRSSVKAAISPRPRRTAMPIADPDLHGRPGRGTNRAAFADTPLQPSS